MTKRHATTAVCAALAGRIRAEARQIAQRLPAAIDGDVRAVHRMRVASRRLRESVPVASLIVARSTVRLEQRLRRLTRALGPVREIDVMRELLAEQAARHEWAPATVARVDRVLRRARDRRRHDLMRALDRLDTARLLRDLDRIAARAEAAPDSRAASVLAARLRRRAGRLSAALPAVRTLYAPAPLHAVRIAAKKLRYTAELVRAMTAVPVAAPIRQLKSAQTLLGGLHDAQSLQIWLQTVAATAPVRPRVIRELDRWIESIEVECRERHARFVRVSPRLGRAAADAGRLPLALVTRRPRRMPAPVTVTPDVAAVGAWS